MTIYAGRTLFISASQRSANHLWLVLSDPGGELDEVVIVSFSTRREGSDPTVVVRPGEHPFIVRDTVIYYADARLVRASQLAALLESGVTNAHADCSKELLTRAQQGLIDSPFTPRWLKGFCRSELGWGEPDE